MHLKKGNFLIFFLLLINFSEAQQPRLVLPIGHTDLVTTACFSSNDRWVLTASLDNTAKLWDVKSGKLIYSLSTNTKIKRAYFSATGKHIVTESDNYSQIWDLTTGKKLNYIYGNLSSFSPDDSIIVSNYYDQVLVSRLKDSIPKLYLNSQIFGQLCPDGKSILTISKTKLRKWRADTGKLIYQSAGIISGHNHGQISPDGTLFASYSTTSFSKYVRFWNVSTGALMFTINDARGFQTFSFSHSGALFATIGSKNDVAIWSLVSKKKIYSLSLKDNVRTIEFSPDDKTLVTSHSSYYADLWDLGTGKLIRRIIDKDSSILDAVFSHDGSKIVTPTLYRDAFIWENSRGSILQDLTGHTKQWLGATFLENGNYLWSWGMSESVIWDPMTLEPINTTIFDIRLKDRSFQVNEKKPVVLTGYDWNMKLASLLTGEIIDSLYIASHYMEPNIYWQDDHYVVTDSPDSTVKVWDIQSHKLLYRFTSQPHGISAAEISSDNRFILTVDAYEEPSICVWERNSGKLIFKKITNDRLTMAKFSQDGNFIYTVADDGKTVHKWQSESGKLVISLTGHTNSITSISESGDGRYLLTTSLDGTGRLWDILTNKIIKVLKGHNSNVTTGFFNSTSSRLATVSFDSLRIWDISGRLISSIHCLDDYKELVFSSDEHRLIAFSRYELYSSLSSRTASIFEIATGKLLTEVNVVSTEIKYVTDSTRNQLISFDNSEIFLTDIGTGKSICSFMLVDSSSFFARLPSGYYYCSPNTAKLLHYVTPDFKIITFEQLDVKYNRPDKVLEAIGNKDTALINSYRRAYEKRIKKLGIDTTAFREGYSVPEADFSNRTEIDYTRHDDQLSLHVKARDTAFSLDRFNLWVNEVPLFGQRGINLRHRLEKNFDTTIRISLSTGENRIETSVTNINGAESYRMPLPVNYIPDTQKPEKVKFIGIALDRFAEPEYNLRYSVKDIRDLALQLKNKYGAALTIDTLFNEEVTVRTVQQLKAQLHATTENDKVIIAYSGHGMLSKTYDYYLSTFTVNFDHPEQEGLPYDELENLLDSIPARKKLLLIDACHSGEVDKEDLVTINKMLDTSKLKRGLKPVAYKNEGRIGLKNSFELMQSLFVNVGKSTGAIIISAASGTQFALERNDLKNGVFTYSILEAMNKYPTIKISELKKIVGARVEELTKGLQKPTSRNETIAVDWKVW